MGRATSQSLTARPTPMAVGHLGGSSPPRRCLRVALDRARAGHRTPLDCRTGTCTHRYHKHFNQIFKLSGDLNLKRSIRIYAGFLSVSLFVLIASGPTQSEPLNWERVTSSDVNQYEDWSKWVAIRRCGRRQQAFSKKYSYIRFRMVGRIRK